MVPVFYWYGTLYGPCVLLVGYFIWSLCSTGRVLYMVSVFYW